jgi:hypothetical protein
MVFVYAYKAMSAPEELKSCVFALLVALCLVVCSILSLGSRFIAMAMKQLTNYIMKPARLRCLQHISLDARDPACLMELTETAEFY